MAWRIDVRLFPVTVIVRTPAGMNAEGIRTYAGLDHKGHGFLVLSWRENQTKGYMQPARVIPLAAVGCDYSTGMRRGHTAEQVPSFVLDDRVPRELSQRYPVSDGPVALFPIQRADSPELEGTKPIQFHPTPEWPD